MMVHLPVSDIGRMVASDHTSHPPAQPAAVLAQGEVVDALRSALGLPEAKIEVLDFSRYPLPPGKLHFDRKQLTRPPANAPDASVFWRGTLAGENGRQWPVWAKVRIAVDQRRVVATRYLKAGTVLERSDLRTEQFSGFPQPDNVARDVESLVGKQIEASQRAGSAIALPKVSAACDVERGDLVRVDVQNGAAHLRLEAQASGRGHKGEVIPIRNPKSGKLFLARISGKGTAEVPGETLHAEVR